MAGQLFIDYKRGVVCSPFYHYGMYSAVMEPQKIYIIPEIEANGSILRTKDFSPQLWDKIEQPVILNDQQEAWNSRLYHTLVQRFLPVRDSAVFLNNYSPTAFHRWYQSYLGSVLGRNIDSVSIRFNIVSYAHQRLNYLSR